jgi:CheY-like chemotaxis protein
MVDSLRPDVVLMDLRMPSSNGFQATEQIVQEHPAVRVVVLSAYETEDPPERSSRRRLRPPPQALRRRPHPRHGGGGMAVRRRRRILS